VGAVFIEADITVCNPQKFAKGLLGYFPLQSQFFQNFTKISHYVLFGKDLNFLIEVSGMENILSILYKATLDMTPTEESKTATRQAAPLHRRLNELAGEEMGDEIWGAAVEAGMADCEDCFRRGFAMGFRLREELSGLTR